MIYILRASHGSLTHYPNFSGNPLAYRSPSWTYPARRLIATAARSRGSGPPSEGLCILPAAWKRAAARLRNPRLSDHVSPGAEDRQ